MAVPDQDSDLAKNRPAHGRGFGDGEARGRQARGAPWGKLAGQGLYRKGIDMLQVVSVVGAITILGAFAADQLGWISPSRLSYALANLVGAGLLTVVAVVDRQVGFIVLQGA